MCVIVLKSPSNPIDRESLKKCRAANPDLFGISVLDANGVIHTWRGQSNLSKTLTRIEKEIPTFESLFMLFHFRISTSGKVNVINSHPFPLDRRFLTVHPEYRVWESKTPVLAHNGVLSGMGDKVHSDTFNLARLLSKLSHAEKTSVLTNMAQYSNKFAIMHTKGIVYFGTFHEYSGAKYSNMNWNQPNTVSKYSNAECWKNWNVGKNETDDESIPDSILSNRIETCIICNATLKPNEIIYPLRRVLGHKLCDDCHRYTKHMNQTELLAYVDSLD